MCAYTKYSFAVGSTTVGELNDKFVQARAVAALSFQVNTLIDRYRAFRWFELMSDPAHVVLTESPKRQPRHRGRPF